MFACKILVKSVLSDFLLIYTALDQTVTVKLQLGIQGVKQKVSSLAKIRVTDNAYMQ